MENKELVVVESVGLRSGVTTVLEDVSFSLNRGESMAIGGSSGSGKTTLGRILAGQLKPTSGKLLVADGLRRSMVNQQDNFLHLSGRRSTYHGQRYENQGMENSPSIGGYLEKVASKALLPDVAAEVESVMVRMHLDHLKDRKLLQLSNGERKRTQLAAALLEKPDLLVLDQPFVGLDVASREQLTALIQKQMAEGISFVLICSPRLILDGVQHVVELHEGKQLQWGPVSGFKSKYEESGKAPAPVDPALFSGLAQDTVNYDHVVRMKAVNVTIGGKQILQNIDWELKQGEQWALLGHNGAGKTTLLSLVTADNPQGYTNDLVLFDRKRGSGESIWDIKNKIGFVSPELHLYFLRGEGIFNTIPGLQAKPHSHYDALSCLDVILSGFKNEIGFASQATDMQRDLAEAWFPALGLEHLKDRLFMQASLGEQRSLLLARALVKSPALLILDEPCQGLDEAQTTRFVHLLDQVCTHLQTTMVYVTHHRNEIPECVSHLLELENGKLSYSGDFNR